ncbi:MAG TPA: DNA starvation/stationary phase protection protein [Clostridiaceae bacterium]|jgi:starvation-inducible DNA-binding protein|nr:DNA starvation/stationary phase protection protein [Clostridiaceae bacterium]
MEIMINDLNQLLADLNVFFRKVQNYHWNIEGKNFFVFHEKLEEYYNIIFKQIDELAEHILILGNEPLGRLSDYMSVTKIKEAENKKVKSDEIITNLITDFQTILTDAIKIKIRADELKKYETSILMDEYIKEYTKIIWMLKQSL